MKTIQILTAIAVMTIASSAFGQMEEGFETLGLDSGQVLNGSDGNLSYSNGSIELPLGWDTAWGGYWASGWALSAKMNGAEGASDFNTQLYCAKPGWGAEGAGVGKVYAVGQNGAYLLNKTGGGQRLSSLYVANTTYAYNSMKNGDMFAKKFGGQDGLESDSFLLEIETFWQGVSQSKQRVALADFRSANSAQDSIMGSWNQVAVEGFLQDSIVFRLFSSDNGDFGMNTPAFFAIDRLYMDRTESLQVSASPTDLTLYPNPSYGQFWIQSSQPITGIQVLDMSGRLLRELRAAGNLVSCDFDLPNGLYTIRVLGSNGVRSLRWICR
ncbi:MAG: hypothetical protein RL577_951 [Bacteroidota bacterium]